MNADEARAWNAGDGWRSLVLTADADFVNKITPPSIDQAFEHFCRGGASQRRYFLTVFFEQPVLRAISRIALPLR